MDKDGSSLELAMLIPVKIRDPFVRIRKKIGPKLNRKSRRKSVVATIEEGALAQKKKAPTPPPLEREEKRCYDAEANRVYPTKSKRKRQIHFFRQCQDLEHDTLARGCLREEEIGALVSHGLKAGKVKFY